MKIQVGIQIEKEGTVKTCKRKNIKYCELAHQVAIFLEYADIRTETNV